MELRHIRYFLEIAETLNFSRAAIHLRIAQPALSKQIRVLEEELGVQLFHRTTKKVALTEAGLYFRKQMRKLQNQADIAVTGVRLIGNGATGTIRVGCDWRTMNLAVASAAQRFRGLHPRVSVEFIESPSHEHVARVRDQSIDVGFVPEIFLGGTEDMESRLLCRWKVQVVLPKGHRLASRRSLDVQELKDERWLSLETDSLSGFRIIMAKMIRFTPKYGNSVATMPLLQAYVIAGYGIGLVPNCGDWALDRETVAVDTNCRPIEMFAIWAKNSRTPLVASYLDEFGDVISESAET